MPARIRRGKSAKAKRASRNGRPRPAARKKLWIFDFDNTIARLEPEVDWAASRRVLEPMLRAAGIPEELFEKHPRGNLVLYNDVRAWLLERGAELPAPASFSIRRARGIIRRASKIIESFELPGAGRAAPLEGAGELLKQLKKSGSTLALATSNSSRTVRRWLALHHLRGVVDTIVGRDSYLALKPSPESVARVLEICEVRARDAAFVGDAESDYRAASALGVEFFGIATDQMARDRLAVVGARRVFSSPAALGIHLNLLDTRSRALASGASLQPAAE